MHSRVLSIATGASLVSALCAGSALAQFVSTSLPKKSAYTIRALPVPSGFTWAGASAVNTFGEAVGSAGGTGTTQPLVFIDDEHILLQTLGGTLNYAQAINEAGQVAGTSQSQPWWGYKAVRWEPGGSMIAIAPLTGDEHDNCIANGINNLGQMVGQSDSHGGMWHAFLWDEMFGTLDLGTLGGAYSAANDINDHSVVVGWSWSDIQTETGFVWEDGVMSELPSLEGGDLPGGNARAINNDGIIVGESNGKTYGVVHAVMWDANRDIIQLGSLGGHSSRAYDINDAGVVVGEAKNESGLTRAFIYSDGVMRDLNQLLPKNSGWELISAYGISDDGRIVGYGALDGVGRSFILEPKSPAKVDPVNTLRR